MFGVILVLKLIIYSIVGITAGILSGLFGIGGGIVIVPALMYISGFSQLKAQGTSVAILLPPVGLLAFIEYYKKGNVDIKAALIICAFVLIGGMFGGKIVNYIPVSMLRKGFAVLMVIFAAKIFFQK
jgi:uncharacterized membrane protein YfcA